ncbi:ABC transporter permease [Hymenobacter sp. RP-2-7]|uniref:ABC transporter permease n=1 Tax=Hymenobacter polaris TaxID=2682546 RepID=A0A7Y0AHE9_9BACT|nr:ABC transporter permease [Hymenobacter polaris]NML67418.1 ABC transporter permease [Hymenobacter polaris]
MLGWLLTRLVGVVLAAWLLASAVFLLGQLRPSFAEQQALARTDEPAAAFSSPGQVAASQQALRQRLVLDQPAFYVTRAAGPPVRWQWHGLHNQYHHWLRGVLRGQWGRSLRDDQPVLEKLAPALAYTLPLMSLALALSTALALGLGAYLASGPLATPGRVALRLVLTGLQALPLFVLALLLLLLLANPEMLDILPAADLGNYDADPSSGRWLAAYFIRLALPLLSLVLAALPELTLPLAAALRHELASPYAVAARAKGVPARRLVWHHALPNAVLPLLVTLTGLLPALVAGAVVVEVLFALPGMGRLLAEAAATQDYPVLIAGVLLTAGVRLLALVAADLLHYWLDPRLRATLA